MGTGAYTIILFGGLLLMLFLGINIFTALGFVGIVVILMVRGLNGLVMVGTTTYSVVTDITFMAIPFFVLMGNLLVHSGISDRLFTALNRWLHKLKGSLAVISMLVCIVLAMCSGFTPGFVTMALIAVPAMLQRNYNKHLAIGSVMAGGILGDVIPPSLMLIVIGSVTRVSIGKLFMGAFIPGFLCAGVYISYILIRCYLQPEMAGSVVEEKYTWHERWESLREVILPLLLVIAVLGAILFGIATPSEAAAVGAFGAMLCCLLYRKFTYEVISESCKETLLITGMALWIILTATFFGQVYTSAGAQKMILNIIGNLEVNRWLVILAMQIILFILGMVLDDIAIITICAPIFMPIAVLLGFSPIWFGVLFVLNMQMAYMSPPFGWCLIMMKALAPPEIKMEDIWVSSLPFLGMQALVLLLVMFFPVLALWLPEMMV
ncbi:MAG: TRAP transporter large permease subunit [Firmicutes bacterium]|nr:TRAP transporter large permease subunit [Bacillota bacterium]